MEYRIKIQVEKIDGYSHDFIGERWLSLREPLAENLLQLSRDREIMEEMKDDHPLAWMEHERNMKLADKRDRTIKDVASLIEKELRYLVELQDTINGYEQ